MDFSGLSSDDIAMTTSSKLSLLDYKEEPSSLGVSMFLSPAEASADTRGSGSSMFSSPAEASPDTHETEAFPGPFALPLNVPLQNIGARDLVYGTRMGLLHDTRVSLSPTPSITISDNRFGAMQPTQYYDRDFVQGDSDLICLRIQASEELARSGLYCDLMSKVSQNWNVQRSMTLGSPSAASNTSGIDALHMGIAAICQCGRNPPSKIELLVMLNSSCPGITRMSYIPEIKIDKPLESKHLLSILHSYSLRMNGPYNLGIIRPFLRPLQVGEAATYVATIKGPQTAGSQTVWLYHEIDTWFPITQDGFALANKSYVDALKEPAPLQSTRSVTNNGMLYPDSYLPSMPSVPESLLSTCSWSTLHTPSDAGSDVIRRNPSSQSCGKTFSAQSELIHHHCNHRHKRLDCPHCPKFFLWSRDPRRHILTHTEKRLIDFVCQVIGCGKSYRREDNLLRHRRLDHPSLPPLAPSSTSSSVSSGMSTLSMASCRSSMSIHGIASSHPSLDSGYHSLTTIHKTENEPTTNTERSMVSASQQQPELSRNEKEETLSLAEIPLSGPKHHRISAWILEWQLPGDVGMKDVFDNGQLWRDGDLQLEEQLISMAAEHVLEHEKSMLFSKPKSAVAFVAQGARRSLTPIIIRRTRRMQCSSFKHARLFLDPVQGRRMVFSANYSGYIASVWVAAALLVNKSSRAGKCEQHSYIPTMSLRGPLKLVLPRHVSALTEVTCQDKSVMSAGSDGFATALNKLTITGTSQFQGAIMVLRIVLAWCSHAKLSNSFIGFQYLGEYWTQILGALSMHKARTIEPPYCPRSSEKDFYDFDESISGIEWLTKHDKHYEQIETDESPINSATDELSDHESCFSHSSHSSTSSCSCLHDNRKADMLNALMRPFSQWVHSRLTQRSEATSHRFHVTGNKLGLSSDSSTSSQLSSSQAKSSITFATSTQSSTSGTREASSAENQRPKRKQQDDGEDDEEDDSRKPKRPKTKAVDDKQATSKDFACPFYKRRPSKYECKKPCWSSSWKSVHRLKCDHLYRHHLLPIRCDRCGQQFASKADRKIHSRREISCDKQDFTWGEGIDEEQEAKLRCRKQNKSKANLDAEQLEQEKWFQLYKILFPDDDPATYPSPYLERTQLSDREHFNSPGEAARAQLEDFVRFDLLAELRRDLAEAYDRRVLEASGELQEQFLNIARAVVDRHLSRTRHATTVLPHDSLPRAPAYTAASTIDNEGPSSSTEPVSLQDIARNGSIKAMQNTTEQWLQANPHNETFEASTVTEINMPALEMQADATLETIQPGQQTLLPQHNVLQTNAPVLDQDMTFDALSHEELNNMFKDIEETDNPVFTTHAPFEQGLSWQLNSGIDFDVWWQEMSERAGANGYEALQAETVTA